MTRTASCACGQLKAHCEGEPVRISICHCLDCKRRSGSAFAYQASWPADHVTTDGEARVYQRSSDEGRWARFSFCPTCGSTVFYEIEARPEMISVPVGGFADPTFPPPTVSVYENRKHPWIGLPDEMIHN